MTALNFPTAPVDGQIYPSSATLGVGQWQWNNTAGLWQSVPFFMQVRQGDYNNYDWPATDGSLEQLLQTDGAGGLSWENATGGGGAQILFLGLLELFDGVNTTFTLVELGTTNPFAPTPSTNIAVFLGGVPQLPVAAYSVSTNTITFTEAPLTGSLFYAISAAPLA